MSTEQFFEQCAGKPGQVHNLVTDAQAHDLCTNDPVVAGSLTRALRTAIDFQKTRGELLRNLATVPDRSPVQQ